MAETNTQTKKRRLRFWEAFKNFALIFSFLVNLILVVVLLLLIRPLFMAKTEIAEPLLGNLDSAFAALGKTNIQTTVTINDALPVTFNLPLQQTTRVVLTEPVPLSVPTTFSLGNQGTIYGWVSLNLPAGMVLPVALDLNVPVNTTVPVVMEVPVTIKLDEAGMGPAITQLRSVFSPIQATLQQIPNSPEEIFSPK
ncbi:MAG TPA: hypothetical protein P5211_03920 [Anaerolineae bacterium]|nr:hypothetical protein [Anaerolineae bacterium]HXK43207.1 hypothetical protein [Anaerolineae bacterium]